MSISIIQTSDVLQPTYNPMFFQVESTLSNQTGFKYVFELKDKDGIIATKKVFPFPNDLGRIDISKMVRDGLSYDNTYTNNHIFTIKNTIKRYELFVNEETPSQSYTPVSTGKRLAFNGVWNQTTNITDFNYERHMMRASQPGKFLTNSPLEVEVYLDDYYTLNFLNGGYNNEDQYSTSQISDVRWIVFVKDGDPSGYAYLNPHHNTLPSNILGTVDVLMKGVGVGPMQLNSTSNITWWEGNRPIGNNPINPNLINSDTTGYKVWGINLESQRTTDIFHFKIKKETTRYPRKQVAFLNRLGSWSYFTFDGKSLETTNIDRDTYNKNRYREVIPGQWGTSNEYRGETTFSQNVEKEITLNSRYIDQPTFDFMEELITSPSVYLLDKNQGALPMIITDTNWTNQKKVNSKEIRFSIKMKFANKINTNI